MPINPMRLTLLLPAVGLLLVAVLAAVRAEESATVADADAEAATPVETPATEDEQAWMRLLESRRYVIDVARFRFDLIRYQNQYAAVRETMDQLANFAETYEDSQFTVVAQYFHGTLASAIGDHEAATRTLRSALEGTDDPQLRMLFQLELNKLDVAVGKAPPSFKIETMDGSTISPADYRGKVLLLDFWASWCMPCIMEIPNLKKAYDQFSAQGLEIVGINMDDEPDAARGVIDKFELGWKHAFNGPFGSGKGVALKYGAEGIPFMVLIGRDGTIRGTNLRGRELEPAIRGALAVSEAAPDRRPQTAVSGRRAPELSVSEWLNGDPRSLADLEGKVVLLDFFQIICPGCHRARPEITRMHKRYADRGFEVIGVATAFELHDQQTPDQVRTFVKEQKFAYPVAMDKGLKATFTKYRAGGTPFTVLIDRRGRIRYLEFFVLEKVEALVQHLLAESGEE